MIEHSSVLEVVFNNTHIALAILDRNFNFIRVNEKYAEADEREVSDFTGRNHFEFYPDDEVKAIFEQVVKTKVPFEILARPFIYPNNPERGVTYWDWSLIPILDSAGDVALLIFSLNDVTAHKRAEEKLRMSEERFKSAFKDAPIGMALVAPDGCLLQVNRSLCHFLGYLEKELVTKNFQDLIHPDDFETFISYVDRLLKEETSYFQIEKRSFHKQGHVVWILLSASLIRDTRGKPLYFISHIQDITERIQMEQELRKYRNYLEDLVKERTNSLKKANEQLQREIAEHKQAEESILRLNKNLKRQTIKLDAINKELESFSYSVSHDLRAPLRSIDGFSQALLEDYEDKLDDLGKDFLSRIRKASQRMSQLIDDLLNLSRITCHELNYQEVNLTALVGGITAELQRTDPVRQVEFSIMTGLYDNGDPRLLRIVLENLLRNAWKFTGKKTRAKIEFGVTEHNSQQAYFVRDNGAGFDMSYARKLFGAFQRLHAITEFPGTGVGLATVKRIIHRHGGQIWAEGAVDQGAVFYFTLK